MDAPPLEEPHELQEQVQEPTGPMPMEVMLTKRGLPMRQSALRVATRVADIIAWERASDNSKMVCDVANVFEDEFKNEADNKRRRVKNTPYKAPDLDSEMELGDTDDDAEEDSELDSDSEDREFDDPTLESEPESEEDEDIDSDSDHDTIEATHEDSEDELCVDSEDGFCVDSEDESHPPYAGIGFRVDSEDAFPGIANDIEDTNTSAEVDMFADIRNDLEDTNTSAEVEHLVDMSVDIPNDLGNTNTCWYSSTEVEQSVDTFFA
jgi:hypothetical protein